MESTVEQKLTICKLSSVNALLLGLTGMKRNASLAFLLSSSTKRL